MTETTAIDWQKAYYEILNQCDELTADARRYRFMRDNTWVECYWIDGAGGVDTKVRIKGHGTHLDLAVDMERVKVPRVNPNARRICPECKASGGPDGVTNCDTCAGGFWDSTAAKACERE
jgi:RecJ-like exonuclease